MIMKIQVLKLDIQVSTMQEMISTHTNQAADVVHQAQVLLLGLYLADIHDHTYIYIHSELPLDLTQGRNLLASGS